MSQRSVIAVALVVAFAAACFAIVSGCSAQGEASPFKNVQLLTHVKTKKEMRAHMKEQAKSLGVKCTFCHVPGKFDLDEKEHKKVAREMIVMVNEINAKYFADEEHGISCWTCHRGNEEPEYLRPPLAPDSSSGFEAAAPARSPRSS